jgi:hypothetical protein
MQSEPGNGIDPTYEVECKIEVRASSPEQAAIIARDMMLDPDARLCLDVYPFECIEAAGESYPTGERSAFWVPVISVVLICA